MKKEIKLGAAVIATWESSSGCFSYDFYKEEYPEQYKECDPNEIILKPNKEYTLIIDYPVSNCYKAKVKTGIKGIARLKAIEIICKHYRKMYYEEDFSPSKRNKYGIWGHNISDLVLCSMQIDERKKVITLGVDS